MFEVGDIVRIFAPQAGHKKYHICIVAGRDGDAHQFLYLNSSPDFEQTYVCDCAKIPCIPKSDTGKTAVTFAVMPRYNDHQLKVYRAEKLGELAPAVALEIIDYAETVTTMTSTEKKIVAAAMKSVSDKANL